MKKFHAICHREFHEKVWKNKFQIMKFIIICFVPFLYGFICCWAFWNPLDNVKNIPIAIVDRDQSPCISYLVKRDGTPSSLLNSPAQKVQTLQKNETCISATAKWYSELTLPDKEQYKPVFNNKGLVQSTLEVNDKYNQKTHIISLKQNGMTIEIKNLVGNEINFKPYDKYWAQLQINQNLTGNIFKLLWDFEKQDLSVIEQDIDALFQNLPVLWTTYKQNFLAGQVLYTFTQIKTALVHQSLPLILAPSLFYLLAHQENNEFILADTDVSTYIYNCLNLLAPDKPIGQYIISKTPEFLKPLVTNILKGVSSVTESAINEIVRDVLFNGMPNVDYQTYNKNIDQWIKGYMKNSEFFNIPTNIEGYQLGEYGIGLGEFFIAVALWVGILMQTFIFDRNCRTRTGRWYQHYFSKLLLMMFTTIVQVTILSLSLCALGFWTMGPSFLLLYVWLLSVGIIFTIIEQAIWFIPDDGDVGKFLIVIYLILNLSAGWGTFPSFMQAGFFNVISVITPFKYLIHGMGTIIYGISAGSGSLAAYQTEILQNFGILLIWVPIFIIFGLVFTYFWRRGEIYGTIRHKLIVDNLLKKQNYVRNALLSTLINKVFINKKNVYYNRWLLFNLFTFLTAEEQQTLQKEFIGFNFIKRKHINIFATLILLQHAIDYDLLPIVAKIDDELLETFSFQKDKKIAKIDKKYNFLLKKRVRIFKALTSSKTENEIQLFEDLVNQQKTKKAKIIKKDKILSKNSKFDYEAQSLYDYESYIKHINKLEEKLILSIVNKKEQKKANILEKELELNNVEIDRDSLS